MMCDDDPAFANRPEMTPLLSYVMDLLGSLNVVMISKEQGRYHGRPRGRFGYGISRVSGRQVNFFCVYTAT